ncbi:MAG: hypothetical protein ACREAW_10670 [Nitrososphaera sp.]
MSAKMTCCCADCGCKDRRKCIYKGCKCCGEIVINVFPTFRRYRHDGFMEVNNL